MTLLQQMITIGLCVVGTMSTRFLPFLIFRENRKTPDFVQYLGKFLPSAVFGMLVVYCLRDDLLYDSFAVFCLIAGFCAVIFFSSIPPSKENHGYCNA